MLNQRLSPFIALRDSPLQLAAACGIGLLLGAACVWFSPLWVLGALAAGAIVVAILQRPEIALLGLVTLTSSFFTPETVPSIDIGSRTLYLTDGVLVALLALIVLRRMAEPNFRISRTPLDWPLLAFYSVIMLSTVVAILQGSLTLSYSLRDIRTVNYYLAFFAVTNLVREDRQLRFLVKGLLALATIVAAVTIAQFVLGGSITLLPGRVETLYTGATSYGGITRIVSPGRSLMMVSFITTTAILVLNGFRPISLLGFLQWALVGMAVVVTFLRSYWATLGASLLILAYLVRGQDRKRLFGWGLVVLFSAVVVLLPAMDDPRSQVARLVNASLVRLGTLASGETLQEASLQWRYVENHYALRQIASHPLLGLGLGARYRPWDPRIDYRGMLWDATRFIHNGHLAVLLASGVAGYLCLMWLSVTFLARGFRYWRRLASPEMRGIVLGFVLTYLAVVFGAVVNSSFLSSNWTPLFAVIMGISEVGLTLDGKSQQIHHP
jgi:O-antigen ligase